MTYTLDYSASIGKVRLLIPDVTAGAWIFSDQQLNVFLELEQGNIRAATALALETIASDTAMTLKAGSILNLSLDGTKVAAELRARGTALRKQAAEAEAQEGPAFDWAELGYDPFSARERLTNEQLREGA